MADISFACASCGQSLEAPGEMAGEAVECPACRKTVTIPVPAEPSVTSCPGCGEAMQPDAVLCVKCGFHTGLGRKLSTDFA